MSTKNVYEELKSKLDYVGRGILCAVISYEDFMNEDEDDDYTTRTVELKLGHTKEELEEFYIELKRINYYSGYGCQYIYGTVWLDDNKTWLSRGEYDGSEWWDFNEIPEIPDNLKLKE